MAYFRKDQTAYWSFLYLSLARILRNVALIIMSIAVTLFPFGVFSIGYMQLIYLLTGAFSLIFSIISSTLLLNEIRHTRAIVRSVLNGGDAANDALRRADPD